MIILLIANYKHLSFCFSFYFSINSNTITAYILLLLLLNLGWGFFSAMVAISHVAFQYLFAVFTILQVSHENKKGHNVLSFSPERFSRLPKFYTIYHRHTDNIINLYFKNFFSPYLQGFTVVFFLVFKNEKVSYI